MIELYNKELTCIENADDIEGAFKSDYGYELFEQNTTDYYTEGSTVIKTGNEQYYEVTVEVSMVGAWQDVGDKLYTIDSIDKVTYKEVEYNDLVSIFNAKLKARANYLEKQAEDLRQQIIE